MTLKELKKAVDDCYNQSEYHHDLEVCVPNNKPSIGPISATKVKSAHKGIDFDKGRFILFTEIKMINKID